MVRRIIFIGNFLFFVTVNSDCAASRQKVLMTRIKKEYKVYNYYTLHSFLILVIKTFWWEAAYKLIFEFLDSLSSLAKQMHIIM